MFGIGFTELLVICVVALIFIGPEKLPELARTAGKVFLDFRKAADDIKAQVTDIAPRPGAANPEARETDTPAAAPAPAGDASTGIHTETAADPGATGPGETAVAAPAQKGRASGTPPASTAAKSRKKTGKTA